MIIDLELNDDIYKSLETVADERGITVKELLRWVVGDYIRYSQPTTLRALPMPLPMPVESETNKMVKLAGVFLKSMMNRGDIKCSNCTMPLTVEDYEQGKCSKCGAEIQQAFLKEYLKGEE